MTARRSFLMVDVLISFTLLVIILSGVMSFYSSIARELRRMRARLDARMQARVAACAFHQNIHRHLPSWDASAPDRLSRFKVQEEGLVITATVEEGAKSSWRRLLTLHFTHQGEVVWRQSMIAVDAAQVDPRCFEEWRLKGDLNKARE